MKTHALVIAAVAVAFATSTAIAAPGGIQTMDGVLADINGMTLYTFDKDTDGVSNCYEQCAVNWPPLAALDGDMAECDYSIIERNDGSKQWAHKGQPLYLWINDTNPGDKTGDGVGGVWHVIAE